MIFSLDLRKRVMNALNNNMHINTAAKVFQVSQRVIYKWKKLQDTTGKLDAKVGYQKGHSHKIIDLNEFKKFVIEHQDYTAVQMAIKWEEKVNIKVSRTTILRALKKIEFTSKKKLSFTKKQIKKREKSF